MHSSNQSRVACFAADRSGAWLQRRDSPRSDLADAAGPGRAPRSLSEALRALDTAEAQLCAALSNQKRLKTDNERLMKSLETASRLAVAAQRVAHHDGLTGLPNRIFLIRRLSQAVATARRQDRQLALLFIDLDGFKAVNDRLGHTVADRLLTAVGSRIAASVRSDDIVCRYGGDEFVALLTNLSDQSIANGVAKKIRDHVGQIYRIEEREIRIAASIGLAAFPENGADYATLLNHADAAMYRDKAARQLAADASPRQVEASVEHALIVADHGLVALARS